MKILLIITAIALWVTISYQVETQFEEDEEEDKFERINNIRKIRNFIIKQRLKGAKQWRNLHS
ncbi:MAG TPA: hypothetical protein PK079_00700 [Leptospiraceae bacterium]|nr:hypothetical protein [Leptospiraceae bacterium]HMW03970.1 hypothetical protein [Leptospiraceae bacterium]HMX33608.1 hypothetical protein [Leptospiraceae bacterium]HMY29950.1 hypothetical protein [Leptospiraceae bacterium]HMZ66773.1 hypothetical protein [Leptospiraceae bacterium]